MARTAQVLTDEQQRLLAALKRARKKADEAEAAYREALAAAKDSGIPVARLAADLGVERKTVYRHLGQDMK